MTARNERPLMKKAIEMSNTPIVSPATAGPTIRAALKIAELRATALPMSSRPTISMTNDWRVGMSTAFVQPRAKARRTICQTWTVPVSGQDREDEGEHHRDRLGRDERPALGQAVGDDPAEQAEDHDRDELGGGHDAEHERVVRQGQDEPGLGDRSASRSR